MVKYDKRGFMEFWDVRDDKTFQVKKRYSEDVLELVVCHALFWYENLQCIQIQIDRLNFLANWRKLVYPAIKWVHFVSLGNFMD